MSSEYMDKIFWLLIILCCIAAILIGIRIDTPSTQWTSIHDELPPSGEVVNICTKDQDVYMAVYQDGRWVEVDREYWEINNVMYWSYRDK